MALPSKRKLKADSDGVWKSRVFPGLWLDGPALVARDTAKLLATAQKGLATPAHAAFVRRLERPPAASDSSAVQLHRLLPLLVQPRHLRLDPLELASSP